MLNVLLAIVFVLVTFVVMRFLKVLKVILVSFSHRILILRWLEGHGLCSWIPPNAFSSHSLRCGTTFQLVEFGIKLELGVEGNRHVFEDKRLVP